MDGQVDDIVDVYRELARVPFVTLARVFNADTPGHVRIYSEWTQRDLERSEKIKFSKNHVIHAEEIFDTPPTDVGTQSLSAESPSGKYRAVLRKVKDKKGEDKQYIEVWSDACKLHNIEVEQLDQHGKVYEDDQFGCWEWSHSETHLLYVAEKKRPKSKSFFDKKDAEKDQKTSPEATTCTRGDEHLFIDDWGEVMKGKSLSVLCVLDVEDGAVSTLDNLPENVAAGQAIWCKEDLGVVCVGWQTTPYHLGIRACPIRKSAIYHIDLKTASCSVIGSANSAVRSPRFNHDQSHLVYLENRVGGPHMQCSKLVMVDWSSESKGVVSVLDVVQKHSSKTASEFPGVYTENLPKRCFSDDKKRLIMSTLWRSKQEIVVVNVQTGELFKLTDDPAIGCWRVLDVHKDLIVAVRSSPGMPHQLVFGLLPSEGNEISIKWTQLDDDLPPLDIMWTIHPLDVPEENIHPGFSDLDYEAILLEPKEFTSPPPCVLFIHGGPHSATPADFLLYLAGFVRCGFAVLAVNYRGSYGFGQESIDCLPGRCGDLDVKDCQHAAEEFLRKKNYSNIVVCGGSHGGFLTAHLIGQYPDFYKAAVCRNPVINITSMLGTTDIPDWCVVEGTGDDFDISKNASAELYAKLWESSPLSHVEKVKTPVMLMIGTDDRRVPPKQGHEFRKALQARGVPVKILEYANNGHALSNVDTEADAFVNIVLWFNKYIQ